MVSIGSILFAAGEGKRLRPLTGATAKPALPLLDVPLGAFGLSSLLRVAPPVVVNASSHAASLEATLRPPFPDGWELFDEGVEGYGTAGTVAALSDRVRSEVVIHNGDVLTDIDPGAVLAAHRASGAGITLAARPVETGADLEVSDDVVTGFIDRRRDRSAAGAQYLGVAVIDAAIARSIPTRRPLGLGESVFAPLAAGGSLRIHPHDGYALDVGTITRYLKATNDLLYGIAPAPPIEFPGRILEHGDDRAYVGAGVVAARTSLGAGAVVLRGAFVDPGAHIERAVVWPGELVPEGELVRDAVWFGGRAIS